MRGWQFSLNSLRITISQHQMMKNCEMNSRETNDEYDHTNEKKNEHNRNDCLPVYVVYHSDWRRHCRYCSHQLF